MSKTVHPPESWQQGYLEGRAEAKKTLRDEFAMTALARLADTEHLATNPANLVALRCYRIADAMLAAREEWNES